MPSLGFLKKKRTKDSTGPRELDSPTSPIKESASPITPTTSKTNSSVAHSKGSAQDSNTASQSTQASTAPSKPVDSMNPSAYPQQAYATPQASPEPYQPSSHNVPSIQNMIHPTNAQPANQQHQNQQRSHDSKPANANGGVLPHAQSAPSAQPAQPQVRVTKGKYTLGDFQIQRTLGTGSFGRVHLVQSKHNQRFYAVKVLKKAQVVKMKQVEHTNDERRMLQQVKHPFLITLWGTFQDSKNLYMVMDFVEGGELFSLLRKSQVARTPFCLGAILLTPRSVSRIPSPNSMPPRSRSRWITCTRKTSSTAT